MTFDTSSPVPYIIGGVFLVLVIYFVFMAQYMKKRKQRQISEFAARLSSTELSKDQKRLLLLGGILSAHRHEKLLSLMPDGNLDMYAYGLREQWDVADAHSAKETIEELLNLERSSIYDEQLDHPDTEIQKIQTKIAKALKISPEEVQAVPSTFSWDTTRAVSLAKWSFWVGYITEEEMWGYMDRAYQIASQKVDSWTQYIVSFLVGRTMQGFDLDDVSAEAYRLLNSTWNKDEGEVYKDYSFKQ